MFTIFVLITFIILGVFSVPFWIIFIYQVFFRRAKVYRITIKGNYQHEFETLLKNIIETQTKYYGDKIKVNVL